MSTQRQSSSNQNSGYRGALVYRQEDGYITITITLSIAPGEHSQVVSHACGLPIAEEAEHLGGVDLYHFAVPFNTLIQLALVSETGIKKAWFVATRQNVFAFVSPLHLTIVRSNESIMC